MTGDHLEVFLQRHTRGIVVVKWPKKIFLHVKHQISVQECLWLALSLDNEEQNMNHSIPITYLCTSVFFWAHRHFNPYFVKWKRPLSSPKLAVINNDSVRGKMSAANSPKCSSPSIATFIISTYNSSFNLRYALSCEGNRINKNAFMLCFRKFAVRFPEAVG